MIKQLSLIFGSKTKAQEILYLLHNAKDVVRQGFYERELDRVEYFCKQKKLTVVKSKFKVLPTDNNFYSNKGIRIPSSDKRPGMYFVYISKDEKKAWMASYNELMNDTNGLGRVLGYPPCCTEFFTKRFSEHNPNLQLQPTNAFTNITRRNHDEVILSHFPCTSDCQASIELAQKYLDVLIKVDKDHAQKLLLTLSTR